LKILPGVGYNLQRKGVVSSGIGEAINLPSKEAS
jgi:hypothetical protein